MRKKRSSTKVWCEHVVVPRSPFFNVVAMMRTASYKSERFFRTTFETRNLNNIEIGGTGGERATFATSARGAFFSHSPEAKNPGILFAKAHVSDRYVCADVHICVCVNAYAHVYEHTRSYAKTNRTKPPSQSKHQTIPCRVAKQSHVPKANAKSSPAELRNQAVIPKRTPKEPLQKCETKP